MTKEMQISRPILLVEDDDVDAMTVRRAVRDLCIGAALVHVVNGEQAIDYLHETANNPPFLILLDLNMPKMNGIEFLKTIKTQDGLKRIPVIVLTTSKESKDVLESFDHGAVGYMVKPVDYKKFTDIISAIILYWRSSQLPTQEKEKVNEKPQTHLAC